MRIFEKEDGLTAKVIGERLGNDMTDGALNRHLRRLVQRRRLYREWIDGSYTYYALGENKR